MLKKSIYLPLLPLFQKYIDEAARMKRIQKNGKIISVSTIKNYKALLVNLNNYSILKNEELIVNTQYFYTKRNFDREKKYYKNFYLQFTNFLYGKGCTDNYVGTLIKLLRSFYIYLNTVKGFDTGQFYKDLYSRREDIPIIVLSQEQLRFLILDKTFQTDLLTHLKVTKDIFVLGCTIGLRFSDIMSLRPQNLEYLNGRYYIVTKSKKLIPLPV